MSYLLFICHFAVDWFSNIKTIKELMSYLLFICHFAVDWFSNIKTIKELGQLCIISYTIEKLDLHILK